MIKDTWDKLMDYTTWSVETYEYEYESVISVTDAMEMSNKHAKEHVEAAIEAIISNPQLNLSQQDKDIIKNSYLLTNIK